MQDLYSLHMHRQQEIYSLTSTTLSLSVKTIFLIAVSYTHLAAASLASCTAQAPKANLKTDIDSLSYSIGMAQTQGLKGYLTGRLDVDTAYMAEFIKGLNEGANKTKMCIRDRPLTVHKEIQQLQE